MCNANITKKIKKRKNLKTYVALLDFESSMKACSDSIVSLVMLISSMRFKTPAYSFRNTKKKMNLGCMIFLGHKNDVIPYLLNFSHLRLPKIVSNFDDSPVQIHFYPNSRNHILVTSHTKLQLSKSIDWGDTTIHKISSRDFLS